MTVDSDSTNQVVSYVVTEIEEISGVNKKIVVIERDTDVCANNLDIADGEHEQTNWHKESLDQAEQWVVWLEEDAHS